MSLQYCDGLCDTATIHSSLICNVFVSPGSPYLQYLLICSHLIDYTWCGYRNATKWLDSMTDLMDMNLSKLEEIVKDGETWCATETGIPKSRVQLNDWAQNTHLLEADLMTCVCVHFFIS